MFELQINNHKIGVFKTLKAARAYEPDWVDAMAAGIDTNTGNYISPPKQPKKIEVQNEIL
jgi:hypothetical protein